MFLAKFDAAAVHSSRLRHTFLQLTLFTVLTEVDSMCQAEAKQPQTTNPYPDSNPNPSPNPNPYPSPGPGTVRHTATVF